MGQITLDGNPPIQILLRQSARAKRLSLRLSRLDGRVTLTLPKGVPQSEAEIFAKEKEAWLRGHLAQQVRSAGIAFDQEIPVEGTMLRLTKATGRTVMRQGEQLCVPGPDETMPRRLQAWLKQLARDRLVAASDRYAQALGKPYARITLRDTRSRWGSCTSDGRLMYSWRLILTPPEVLNYVAAHEVAHLAHMNHSPAFWDTVTDLYGPWKAQRTWLRKNGTDLHRYVF